MRAIIRSCRDLSKMSDTKDQNWRYRNLVMAVLWRAIIDHQEVLRRLSSGARGRDERQTVISRALMLEPGRWLMSDDPGPYGCVWCCEILEMDVGKLRSVMNTRELLERARSLMKVRDRADAKDAATKQEFFDAEGI